MVGRSLVGYSRVLSLLEAMKLGAFVIPTEGEAGTGVRCVGMDP